MNVKSISQKDILLYTENHESTHEDGNTTNINQQELTVVRDRW